LHRQQSLASRSGRFGVQAAGDEVSLAAPIQFCSGSCHVQRLSSPLNFYQTIIVFGITGPASLVLLIICLVKFNELKSKIG
jgi:hypothetical protein